MRDRFDADLLLDEQTREQGTHAALRSWTVGNVDCIDARILQCSGVVQHLGCIDTTRWHDFDRRNELTARQLTGELRALSEWKWLSRLVVRNLGVMSVS